MKFSIVKGSLKMVAGKMLQNIGSYTSNNDLYFIGKKMEIMGDGERKYYDFKNIIHL
jgi:uncharacterized protein YjbJ (UPF0337 family)